MQPLYFSGFSSRTNTARRGFASSTASLGSKGNLAFSLAPSCQRHQDLSKVQDSLMTAGCRWCFDSWKQSSHLSNPQAGRAVKYSFTSEQLLESIGRERLSPSGPCCLASQQSHFHLQPGYWCFVSVSLMWPWAELWAQCLHRRRLAGQLPSSGLAAGATAAWACRRQELELAAVDAGAVSVLPGFLQCSALFKPKHSKQAKSLSAGWFDLV